MVMMTPVGAGIRGSIYHSHSFDAQATHIPGWKIVMPSTPRDAYGLLLTAIVDPNPVHVPRAEGAAAREARPGEEIPGEPDDDTPLSKMIDAPLGDRTPVEAASGRQLEDLFIPIGKGRTVRAGPRRHGGELRAHAADVRQAADDAARRGHRAPR